MQCRCRRWTRPTTTDPPMDKLPFSVYDFFGYLSAGFVLLVGLAAAFTGTESWQRTPGATVGLLLVVVAYTAGHVIANLSGYLIEGTLVRRVLGTPSILLFQERSTRSTRSRSASARSAGSSWAMPSRPVRSALRCATVNLLMRGELRGGRPDGGVVEHGTVLRREATLAVSHC